VIGMDGKLKIFDGIVGLHDIQRIYAFVLTSKYVIGWHDTNRESNTKSYLHSNYSNEDVDNLNLLELLKNTEIAEIISGMERVRVVVNMSVPSNVHYAHSHNEEVVVLYYANPEWAHHWHGETHFYNFDGTEVQHAISFKPGRIVVFDGRLPHAISPQSSAGPDYRFTIAFTFRKK